MKKLLLFVVAFCGFTVLSHNADAKCTLLSCGDTRFLVPNDRLAADIGGNQCWFCGPGQNSCSDDEVVPYLDGVGDVIGLYQCSTGFTSAGFTMKFVNYEPGYFCKDSELQSGNGLGGISLSNAKKTYRIDGVTTSSFSLGDLEAFVGRASCIYIKCNYGYMPNSDKTECIADNREQDCVASGGTWTGSTCTCDVAKNLRVENNACVCLDDVNYVRNGNKCDLTDVAALQQKCESDISVASGAYWDSNNKQCLCTKQNHIWRNGKCEMNPAITQCLQISGANWNNITQKCYCVQQGYEINADYTACEQTEESRLEQQAAELAASQAASLRRIESAVSKMNDIASGLKLTVWRNEEGKFNTSRLLSDAIAGVVLGTAGGLITSHVVKKNNIENGFEDIQCTIGGQVVAGWGDEFRVGIQ